MSNLKSSVIQKWDGIKTNIEYIGYYNMLDRLVELIDEQPEHIPSIIQSYENILSLIVRLKESENKCQN